MACVADNIPRWYTRKTKQSPISLTSLIAPRRYQYAALPPVYAISGYRERSVLFDVGGIRVFRLVVSVFGCLKLWQTSKCTRLSSSVQRFFTRKQHGLSNRSYPDRLHALRLETLEHRRLIHDVILCYKYLHGLIDTDNRNFWCVQLPPRTRNNGLKLYKAHCNINARKSFFTNRIVEIWNSLPSSVVFSHNVYTFKRRLTELNFYRFLHYT